MVVKRLWRAEINSWKGLEEVARREEELGREMVVLDDRRPPNIVADGEKRRSVLRGSE